MNSPQNKDDLFKEIKEFLDDTSIQSCLIELSNSYELSKNLIITLKNINNSDISIKSLSIVHKFLYIMNREELSEKNNSLLIHLNLKDKEKEKIDAFLMNLAEKYSQTLFSASNNTYYYNKMGDK